MRSYINLVQRAIVIAAAVVSAICDSTSDVLVSVFSSHIDLPFILYQRYTYTLKSEYVHTSVSAVFNVYPYKDKPKRRLDDLMLQRQFWVWRFQYILSSEFISH